MMSGRTGESRKIKDGRIIKDGRERTGGKGIEGT
jgi:hypothetical protein